MAYHIGFLLYPGLTQLDLTGPAQILHRMPDTKVHFVWKELEPVMSDCGLALVPTTTIAECPPLDMICVPGGYGCTDMMVDAEVLEWLTRQAATASLVTSVCTGSLILAAAGLLDGYRAGCHWAWGDQLPLFGAQYVAERTVVDRNRITAGGVTSGIDFAFRIIEQLHGTDAAAMIQLSVEYDPQPLEGGTPSTARPEIVARMRKLLDARMGSRREEIARAALRRADQASEDLTSSLPA